MINIMWFEMAHSVPKNIDETLYWIIHSDKDHDLTDRESEYVSVKIDNIQQYEKLIKLEKQQDQKFSHCGGFFLLKGHAIEFLNDLTMNGPISFYVIFAYVGKRLDLSIKRLGLIKFSSMYASECLISTDANLTMNNLKGNPDNKLFPLQVGGAILVTAQQFYDKLVGPWDGESLYSTNLSDLFLSN